MRSSRRDHQGQCHYVGQLLVKIQAFMYVIVIPSVCIDGGQQDLLVIFQLVIQFETGSELKTKGLGRKDLVGRTCHYDLGMLWFTWRQRWWRPLPSRLGVLYALISMIFYWPKVAKGENHLRRERRIVMNNVTVMQNL